MTDLEHLRLSWMARSEQTLPHAETYIVALEAQAKWLAADNYTLAGRALHAEAEVERLRRALEKVRAHTGHVEVTPKQLHIDLLASIARIIDAALAGEGDEDA